VDIFGTVEPGYEPVRDAFVSNFTDYDEIGAAFSLYVRGQKVVDLWAGVADRRAGKPWEQNTMALVFSTTKGMTAILVHLLAQRGLIDLDAPVAKYWPEFATAGKAEVPVRWLLSHRAGLPTFDQQITAAEGLQWSTPVAALARQQPLWEPGTTHGYHAITYGWLVGEVVRRATGRTVGQLLAEEIARPLELDCWIGLPPSEEHRVARLSAAPVEAAFDQTGLTEEERRRLEQMLDPQSLLNRTLNPTQPPFNFNSPEMHAAEMPAANGITTARSLAALYAASVSEVQGVRLLDPATVAAATQEQSFGPDQVLQVTTRFGSGFFLSSEYSPLLGPGSFGHGGAGGSLGMADPARQIGFGYVMNQMRADLSGDPRPARLADAVDRVVPRD